MVGCSRPVLAVVISIIYSFFWIVYNFKNKEAADGYQGGQNP